MFCHGIMFALISILVRQHLDLFPDWYVYSYLPSLLTSIWLVSSVSFLNFNSMQVQSLPRMIITDEIGKQVIVNAYWMIFWLETVVYLPVY